MSTTYTTPSYSGGPGCKSVAENRLFWPRDFGLFLISYIQLISNDSQQSGYHRGYHTVLSSFNITEHCILSTQITHVNYMALTINIKSLVFIIDCGVFNERQKIKPDLSITLDPCVNKIEIQPRGSRRPLTAQIRFLFQASQRGICGGQCGTGTGFLPTEWTEVVNDKTSEHSFHQQFGERRSQSGPKRFRTPSDKGAWFI